MSGFLAIFLGLALLVKHQRGVGLVFIAIGIAIVWAYYTR